MNTVEFEGYAFATLRNMLLPKLLSGELREADDPMANAGAICRSA